MIVFKRQQSYLLGTPSVACRLYVLSYAAKLQLSNIDSCVFMHVLTQRTATTSW